MDLPISELGIGLITGAFLLFGAIATVQAIYEFDFLDLVSNFLKAGTPVVITTLVITSYALGLLLENTQIDSRFNWLTRKPRDYFLRRAVLFTSVGETRSSPNLQPFCEDDTAGFRIRPFDWGCENHFRLNPNPLAKNLAASGHFSDSLLYVYDQEELVGFETAILTATSDEAEAQELLFQALKKINVQVDELATLDNMLTELFRLARVSTYEIPEWSQSTDFQVNKNQFLYGMLNAALLIFLIALLAAAGRSVAVWRDGDSMTKSLHSHGSQKRNIYRRIWSGAGYALLISAAMYYFLSVMFINEKLEYYRDLLYIWAGR